MANRRNSEAHTMSLREAKARFSETVNAAQSGYVLVTRYGRPAAVIVGVEGVDVLDVAKRFASFKQP